MRTPVLYTSRLRLRPLCAGDAEHIFRSWTSDPEVARFMIWELHESVFDTTEWLAAEQLAAEGDSSYVWGIELIETGLLIGSCGLVYVEERGCFELGYNLMKSCWGKGFAVEASRAALDFAIKELGQKRFFCRHAKDNLRSRRVIEKLGFEYAGDASYESAQGKKHFECMDYYLEI